MKNKIPIYKSDNSYEKYLDLLLFFSKNKYDEHLTFCETNKTMILMPSRNKYLEFRNIKNTIKLPFVIFADIESYMTQKTIKKSVHNHLGLLFTLYK